MSEDIRATGRCLCGAVAFEIADELRAVIACHCGQCQRTHGNFAAYSATPRDGLTLVEDRGLAWYRSSPTARRGFCRECGASLFWDADGRDYVAVAAGALDHPSGVRLAGHIYVADKPDWYEIADTLPRHEGSMSAPDA